MNWRKDSRKAFGYAFLVGCAAFAPVASGSTIDSYGGAVVYASDGTYCYKVTIGDGVAYGGGEIIQNTGASSGCESLDYTVGGTDVYAIGYYASTSGDDQNYDDGDYCPPISGSRTALLSLEINDSATEQTLVSDELTTCYYTFELTASSTSLVIPSDAPSATPSDAPSATASDAPSATPSDAPSATPSDAPTGTPSDAPSATPSALRRPLRPPSDAPSAKPSDAPTAKPSDAPSAKPSAAPTSKPSDAPTAKASDAPTAKPSASPTTAPTNLSLDAGEFGEGDGSFTEDECDPHREDRVTCGCLAVTKKRKCNRRAKCAWVGGSHKCLADCEVLTKESRCRKERNCVYKSGVPVQARLRLQDLARQVRRPRVRA
ncbi:hypothetical protein JL721_5994 [Aureococcus anophagefferens]|nr:hypothetical protein JL721_5994 [Aureococcus anophagefferens]